MLDKVTIRRGKKTVVDIANPPGHQPEVMDSVELGFDDHFGIQITQGEQWTEMAVRVGKGWSAPVDTRELIDMVRRAQTVKVKTRRR